MRGYPSSNKIKIEDNNKIGKDNTRNIIDNILSRIILNNKFIPWNLEISYFLNSNLPFSKSSEFKLDEILKSTIKMSTEYLIIFSIKLSGLVFLDLSIQNYFLWFLYLFLAGLFLGSAGVIAGLYADKFDQMATVTNFLIVPLSFLSGTFYSIERLPDILKSLSYYNPFFHMIDGFRYSFIGQLDGSLKFGITFLLIISIVTSYFAYLLFKKGYKIKS